MTSPVLLPAGFILVGAHRRFLALADDLNAVAADAEVDEVVADGGGAALAEGEVVLGGAARVAVPLHHHLRRRPALQPVGVLLQHRLGIVADCLRVEIEVGVAERLLDVELIQRLTGEDLVFAGHARLRRLAWRGRRRRWRGRGGPRRFRAGGGGAVTGFFLPHALTLIAATRVNAANARTPALISTLLRTM